MPLRPSRVSWSCGLLVLALCAPLARAAAPPPLAAGQPFPRLTGRMLSGGEGALPDLARGRVTLVMLGFTYASRHPVADWAARFRERFATDSLVTLYEVPMIGGMARMAAPFIESGMRKGTPRELLDRVLIVYGDTRAWKTRAGWTSAARDDAYLVLVDASGTVRWLANGPFEARLFLALAAEVERLRLTAPEASTAP